MQSERQRMAIPCQDPSHSKTESDAVYEFGVNRAIIEQAKGMLMFVYGIDSDQAFERLREQSQQHNVKLRLIAKQVLTDLVELSRTSSPARRMEHDLLLRTAHQRISDAAARHQA